MTGRQLAQVLNDGELHHGDLQIAGVADDTIVRVNEHGDIEVRRREQWDVVGGLLGDYDERLRRVTGLDWT
jgi:hypothetical protein